MSSTNPDVSRVAGPAAMAKPGPSSNNPPSVPLSREASSTNPNGDAKPKKKRHRAGKNRKKRRPSFVAESEASEAVEPEGRPSVADVRTQEASFYRLRSGNRSNTSLESEALLDHREQSTPTARRRSMQQSFTRPSLPFGRDKQRASQTSLPQIASKSRLARSQGTAISEDEDEHDVDTNDRTPLLGNNFGRPRPALSRNNSTQGYGSNNTPHKIRRASENSKASSKRSKKRTDIGTHNRADRYDVDEDYDVNNPPSVPGSPKLGSLNDVMVPDLPIGSERGRDAIINIDFDGGKDDRFESASPDAARRRHTVADLAERDVCFPADVSEMGDEDADRRSHTSSRQRRRRRPKQWPDLDILEEWSREEKEERTQQEYIRAKKISEPVMVGGRLRPRKPVWHREEDDAPFRFTYFNELFEETIHARTISDLCQDTGNFRELFIPDPVELSDDSEDDGDEDGAQHIERPSMIAAANGRPNGGAQAPSILGQGDNAEKPSGDAKKSSTGTNTPSGATTQAPTPVPGKSQPSKRYGARPTFWLDVLSPTEVEMKVLAKAFGIHQLTIEDILMDEPREKVELFQSYYFVNYRSFEQDKDSEDYMEPINMYVVVFRDGVITFHHSQTPHPANVRRRIRQLNDYMSPTADWVSYAIIDDITDTYAPIVQHIEDEVDEIDDEILYMHQQSDDEASAKEAKKNAEKQVANTQGDMGAAKAEGEKTAGDSGGDMLRRVGECRKKVMGLYRLLGNKADVIKGFAKRCNEHWEVAPRSEIGLYLGDIQDHIVTMTGNLSHYEK